MKLILPKVELDKDLEDASWAYFSKNFLIRSVYLKRLKKALKLACESKNNKILDLGTGCGILLPSLSQYGEVYGLDYSKKYLDKAKQLCENHNLNVDLSRVNINEDKLPYQDNFFDVIISLSVLEHIKDLDIALKKVYRILKKEGIFIVGVPVEEFLVKLFFKQQKIDKEVEEVHIQNYNTIEESLKNYFDIVEIDKLPFRFIPDKLSIYKIFKCVKK